MAGVAGASVASAANARLCRGAACGACGARRRARAAVRSISAMGYPMNVASQRSREHEWVIVRVLLGSCRGEFACRSPGCKASLTPAYCWQVLTTSRTHQFRALPPARTETRRSVVSKHCQQGAPAQQPRARSCSQSHRWRPSRMNIEHHRAGASTASPSWRRDPRWSGRRSRARGRLDGDDWVGALDLLSADTLAPYASVELECGAADVAWADGVVVVARTTATWIS